MSWSVHHGDCIEWLRTLPADSLDGCVTWLHYVGPCPAAADIANTAGAHSVPLSKGSVRLVALPDEHHGCAGELRCSALLPTLGGAMGDLVRDVLFLGAPREVAGRIIVPSAVNVPHNASRGPATVERLADQRRDSTMNPTPTSADNELPIAVLVDPARQGPPGVDGLNLALAAHGVLGGLLHDTPLGHGSPRFATIPRKVVGLSCGGGQ